MHTEAHTGSGQAYNHLLRHHHPLGRDATHILGASVLATLLLVVAELAAGYAGHSIALVSDAIHNLTDVPTLVISWLAMRWALRPPTHEKTYGYHRAGILAAFVNALVLALAALVLIVQSFARLRHPVEVHASLMIWISLLALGINGGITLAVHRGRRDLNVRTVWIHNLGDALSNIAILAGAFVIRWTGARWLDPLLAMGIGAMVLWSGAGILRQSAHILLEGLPRDIVLAEVVRALLRIEGIHEVHDVHIWTIGDDLHALSCHARIPDMHLEDSDKILAKIAEMLARDFHITHTTVQFERALPPDADLYMPAPLPPPAR
jgi:cobalt-zinc-cadmium efflux system protein